MPPKHPCRFPFPFPFFFSSFFLSLLSFSVVPFLFRLVVLPFVSYIAFFAFLFASPLCLVTDSVILLFRLGDTPPPRSLRACSIRLPLACCLLSCVLAVDLFYFSSLPSLFSISIWTSFVSSCLFLVGTMLSPRFRFLLRLV